MHASQRNRTVGRMGAGPLRKVCYVLSTLFTLSSDSVTSQWLVFGSKKIVCVCSEA